MAALSLAPLIEDKTVVEIGGGIGLLAMHMGYIAKTGLLHRSQPHLVVLFHRGPASQQRKNVSYLFGAASEFEGLIKADVAVFCTHSGIASMKAAGALFAPVVVDVYGEMIAANPEGFNKTAMRLRTFA